jgi:glycosyltransferase involved in cell wall biosynthesis
MNHSRKNILVLTQWSYKDPLIQAYTLPYVLILAKQLPPGSKIYLVTFEQQRLKMTSAEKVNTQKSLSENGIVLIDYSYSTFGLLSLTKMFFSILHLITVVLTKQISFIHAWCTPAGSMGYVLSKLTGKPLIIDSYEPHAEAMVENNTWKNGGFKHKVLFYFEKKLSSHAKILISATRGMADYAKKKYDVVNTNFFVKPACTDLNQFSVTKRKNPALLKELNLEDKIVCVYAGKFGGIYLTNEVFDFFQCAETKWGDRFRVLLLTSHDSRELIEWADKSGFSKDKMIMKFVPHESIADYLGLGDFGITPVKPIPTKKYCTPIKDGEYWALGLPVVITDNISDDSGIIAENDAGAVLKNFSTEDYNNAIKKIEEILKEPQPLLMTRIQKLAKQYRDFSIAEEIYRKIYRN